MGIVVYEKKNKEMRMKQIWIVYEIYKERIWYEYEMKRMKKGWAA